MSIESVMPSNHLTICHPLLLLPSIFPSIRVFSNILVLHIRWPKYWSFSFSISPSNEYSEFISFRIDCFDLFAVQGTLKSSPTPQFKSIKSSALSFLYGPFSHPYMPTGKTITISRWTFVGKVTSLLFNMLSCHSFYSKEQVSFHFIARISICSDFGAQENKVCCCFYCFTIYLP